MQAILDLIGRNCCAGGLTVCQLQLARTLDRLPVTRDYLYPAATARSAATPRRTSQRRASA
ncbi:hypothetical protein [Stutzerimonas stutzeri]|uniref:hypothetical protein n=1 Tax=Stutzerimonas stutzeri TaxID=316 RepID=UPI00210C6A2D|nr:hypothetical protein [Stutzerimonas stutzeri]MCQ4318740.1 hypothetical protein [Stutzerimonas stutzeri]